MFDICELTSTDFRATYSLLKPRPFAPQARTLPAWPWLLGAAIVFMWSSVNMAKVSTKVSKVGTLIFSLNDVTVFTGKVHFHQFRFYWFAVCGKSCSSCCCSHLRNCQLQLPKRFKRNWRFLATLRQRHLLWRQLRLQINQRWKIIIVVPSCEHISRFCTKLSPWRDPFKPKFTWDWNSSNLFCGKWSDDLK